MHSHTYCGIIHYSQDTEATYVHVSRLTDKDAACGHSRILFSHEKEENLAICDNTVSEDTAKISQRKANTTISLICGPKMKAKLTKRRGYQGLGVRE